MRSPMTLAWEAAAGSARPGSPAMLGQGLEGRSISGYRLTRQLGRGGMASVYLAEHPENGSRVAIKVMHPTLAGDASLVQRFLDEARAANRIAHENIVRVYSSGLLEEGLPYLAMEYLEGQTLADLLAAGPIPVAQGAAILFQLCEALASAHACGVVHRDIKPENVFLVRSGANPTFVKVMDFGIAKLLEQGPTGQTTPGLVLGTPDYMSPEQCAGLPVDARSDLYSLGVIAYRMSTGRLPFKDPSPMRVMMAHVSRQPPAPRELNPRVPEELEAVLLQALAKDPAQRYPTARALELALRHALARFLRPRTPEAVPARTPSPTPAPVAPTPTPVPHRAKEASRFLVSAELLGEPGRRLAREAAQGHYLGVARLLAEGFPEEQLGVLRELFVSERPGLSARLDELQANVQAARAEGNLRLAMHAVEAVLAIDPLNLQLHRDREVLGLLLSASCG